MNIPKLREGIIEYLCENSILTCDFAFIDEIFDASDVVLRTLLGVLNERIFAKGSFQMNVQDANDDEEEDDEAEDNNDEEEDKENENDDDLDKDDDKKLKKLLKKNPFRKVNIPNLPKWIRQEQFENDTYQMFRPKDPQNFPQDLISLKEQVTEPLDWDLNPQRNELNALDDVDASKLLDFFNKIPETKLFREILSALKYDSKNSAKMFINLMVAEMANKPNKMFDDFLNYFLKVAKDGMPLLPFFLQEFGNNPGNVHFQNSKLQRALKIQEILKRIDFKYQHMKISYQKKEPTFYPEDDIEPRRIQSMMEPIITPEMLLPEEQFTPKLLLYELHTYQHFKYLPNTKTYVMLIDVSGSMASEDRITYACASAISLISNALKGSNRGIIMTFDGNPHEPKEFPNVTKAVEFLMDTPFSGGGTSINNALKKADTLNADEIILITDGEDNVTYTPQSPLYTIFCSQQCNNQRLKEISTKFELYR